MIFPPRKILNVIKTDDAIHFDVRITVPFKNTSSEFVEDMIAMKDRIINGLYDEETNTKYFEYRLSTNEDINGVEQLSILSYPVEK